MVLLILAAIWAVVLIPPWIRSRRDVRPARSMVSFQQRLSSLERAVPLVGAYSDEMYLDASSHHELGPGVGDDDPAAGGVQADLVWDDDPVDASAVSASGPGSVAQLRPVVARPFSVTAPKASSRLALHRRRQIFFVLLLGAMASLGAAVIVNSVVGWAVHGGSGVLFIGYVWLLVRHHHRAMDRATKVRYLAPTRAPRPAVVVLHGTAR
ncbi:MAG: hypothetical protein ACRD2C_18480 [Acidimicrobiales bacterium]